MYFFFFASTYTLFFEKNTSDVAIIIHCRRRARINRDTLKKFLTGNNGKWEPMPVAVSLFCFASWQCSPFTGRTGWFSMPVPDENKIEMWARMETMRFAEEHPEATKEELAEFYQATLAEMLDYSENAPRDSIPGLLEGVNGAHAMVVVGYADEPLVAGGGYFLVRNSWAPKWGWDSDHPGHAKVPYAYFEHFCGEAMSIIKPLRKNFVAASRREDGGPDDDGVKEALSPSEIRIVLLTSDPKARQEANHLTHRLSKDGYAVRLEADRLPPGKLREQLAKRPEDTRDVILLAGRGALNAAPDAPIYGEIAQMAKAGRNIVSIQLGQLDKETQQALPETFRELVSYNRLKIHDDSFDDDFSELKMRLASRARRNSSEDLKLYRAFRKACKDVVGSGAAMGPEATPDLYGLLRKNMSFRMLEALARYLLRRGFRMLTDSGSPSPRRISEALSSGGRPVTMRSERGGEEIRIDFDKRRNTGSVLQQTQGTMTEQGFYHSLRQLFASADGMVEPQVDEDAVEPDPAVEAERVAETPRRPETETRRGRASAECGEAVTAALREKNSFFDGVDQNIRRIDADYCFPDLDLPVFYKLLPWKLQVREVIERECRPEDLIAELEKLTPIAPEDRELMEKTCGLRLYELKNGGVSVMIVAAYVTMWENGRRIPPDVRCLAALRHLQENLKKSMQNLYCLRLSGVGLLIGTADAAAGSIRQEIYRKNAEAFRGGSGEFVLYCDCNSALDTWSFIFPEGVDGYYWWRFVEHLLPIEPVVRLRELLARGNDGGTTTEARLEKSLGLPHGLFASAFAKLKPRLRKRKGTEKDAEPQYELDSKKEHDISCSVSGFRRVSSGVWNYVHCVIYSGAFAIGGIIAASVNAHVAVRVLILGFTSLVAKTIVEWNDRRIKHQ